MPLNQPIIFNYIFVAAKWVQLLLVLQARAQYGRNELAPDEGAALQQLLAAALQQLLTRPALQALSQQQQQQQQQQQLQQQQ
jgi:hypothetical protein